MNNNEYDYTLQYGKSFDYPFKSVNSELYICNNINSFQGCIGTILLFESFFPKEITQIIMSFKGYYESILLCNECNLYNVKNDIRNFENYFSKLSEFKIVDKLKGIISPKSILIKSDNNWKENSYEIKNNKINKNSIINGDIKLFFNLSFSVYNFLYFNGLKYLQLNCEYYIQILKSEKFEKDYNIINKNILNLIQFLSTILNKVNNNFLYFENCFLFSNENMIDDFFIDLSTEKLKTETNELLFLLSSICEVIKLSKGDKSLIIEELIAFIPLLYIKENSNFISSILYKIINFLLNKDLYNEETKKILPKVYLTIYDCMICSNFDLLKTIFLKRLIEMNDISFEYSKLLDLFLFKLISNEPIKNNKLDSTNESYQKINKSEQLNVLLKKIIKKIKDVTVSISDLDFISNVLILLYKNLYDIKAKNK